MTAIQIGPFSPATDMLWALQRRAVSASELLDLHLQRIERFNPSLNAIVTRNFEEARRTAAEADRTRGTSEVNQPLLGLPLTIKDCIYVRGLVTTGGVVERAHAVSAEDAVLARRVRAAGAVIMGKTNVPPYAADWQTTNPLFGRTNNPWNLERTPGGSTGGGAAAVAAGLSPLEFGGDLAGSIRVPAAFCGVYGHKSSETALARSGHFPGELTPNWATAMGVQGPLARSAKDLETALRVIAGPEVGEDVAWKLQLPRARHETLTEFRVAILPIPEWMPVDPDIAGAVRRLRAELVAGGARVRETVPEGFDDLRRPYDLYTQLLFAVSTVGQPAESRLQTASKLRSVGYEAAARGLEASASDYIIWHGQREKYRAAYRAFFREWDILLSPAALVTAFPHTDAPVSRRSHAVAGRTGPYDYLSFFPSLASLTGQPATAFPFGFSSEGLPIGLQAIGPYLEDFTPIRFAQLVEEHIEGFVPPPGYT